MILGPVAPWLCGLLCLPVSAIHPSWPALVRMPPAHSAPLVVLDPGHGGPDTGGVYRSPQGTVEYTEKSVTLNIARRTAKLLRAGHIRVLLTRTRDQAVNVPPRDLNGDGVVNGVDEAEARVRFANKNHAAVFVSIHINANNDPHARGLVVYYCPAHPFWRLNRKLARLIDRNVASGLHRQNYHVRNYGTATDVSDKIPQAYPEYPWFLQIGPADAKRGLVANRAVAALGETLYLTNPHEDRLLHRSRILESIAQGYARGIEDFLRLEPHLRGGGITHSVRPRTFLPPLADLP